MNRIALALTVAAISTSAAAQSNRKQPTWDDLLKPLDVKTNPAIPIAPPQPPAPVADPSALIFEIDRYIEELRTGNPDRAKYNRIIQDACDHLVGIQGASAVRRCVIHNTMR